MLCARRSFKVILTLLLVLGFVGSSSAQGVFPFTSGPIPMCDTSTFTANVSGIGYLIIPNGWDPGPFLDSFVMNISTDHPQTLQITLTSPQGTVLLLSAFNGAGGQNYTNTQFQRTSYNSITTGSAPFTGQFMPQGGSLDAFGGEYADGTWVVTVVDTACANGGTGPGGIWTPGWFNGSSGNGAFAFGFDPGQPQYYDYDMGAQTATLCPGGTVDIMSYFETNYGYGFGFTAYDQNFNPVVDPFAVTQPGQYSIEYAGGYAYYHGTFTMFAGTVIALGPDQIVDHCGTSTPVALPSLFNLAGLDAAWTLSGQPITNVQAATASISGVYQLVASSVLGCPDTALVTLNIHATPALGADQVVSICPGGTADLGALYDTAGLPATWTFSGAPVSDPAAVDDAGMYTLVVTSPEGCTDTADVTLTVDVLPSLGADQSVAICNNTVLDLTSLFPIAGQVQTWTLSGAPVANPTSINTAGAYQVVVSTASACADTALVVVSMNAAPGLGADAIAAICTSATVDLTGVFPTVGLSTAWYENGAVVAAPDAVGSAGLYSLVATNADGCSDTANVQVNDSPTPALGPDQSLTQCAGEMVDLQALYPTGIGSAAWTLNGAAVADPSAVDMAGPYVLVVTTAAGCADTAAVNLQFNVAPVLGNDQSVAICVGESVDLGTFYNTTGLSAVWTYGAAPVTDPGSVNAAGNYQLVVTNAFNCADMAVVHLTVNIPPALGPDQLFNLCPWQSVDLTTVFPVAGTTATYMLNGQPVADPSHVTEAGIYTVTAVDANGCSDEAMATAVPVECICAADFTEDARCLQEPVQFNLLADSTVLAAHWDFHGAALNVTSQDPAVRFNKPGELQVTLHATLSCGEITVDRIVTVQDCSDSCSLYIPAAYTPNGDGVNDGWTWQGECIPKNYSMKVFDRWGAVVFSSTDPYKAWDGTANGKELPSGVYAYRAAYQLLYQDPKEEVGTITLLR